MLIAYLVFYGGAKWFRCLSKTVEFDGFKNKLSVRKATLASSLFDITYCLLPCHTTSLLIEKPCHKMNNKLNINNPYIVSFFHLMAWDNTRQSII